MKNHSNIDAVCDRLRGQMYNSPRRQYFRITRAEAEALVALNRRQSESKTQ